MSQPQPNDATTPSPTSDDSGLRVVRPATDSSASASSSAPPGVSPPAPAAPPSKPPASRARLVFVALLALAGLGGGAYVWTHRGLEATDDAQVEGHIVNVASRVAGQVAEVLVVDNQLVHEGDPLVRLDASDYEARLAQARAEAAGAQASLEAARAQLALTEATVASADQQARGGLTSARAGLSSAAASIQSAQAAIEAARSRVSLTHTELARAQQLFAGHSVAQAELDARQAAYDQAQATLAQSEAALAAAQTGRATWLGQIDTAQGRLVQAAAGPEQVAAAHAAVAQAEARVAQTGAAVRLAELQLGYATVRAPITGYVSRRTVEPGAMVSPERAMMALVGSEDVWVVANFKEDQIAEMRPGQPVTIEIDAFDGIEVRGHVESLAGATGARFSLIPPDNASGNFTKVVQRVPVRIAIDDAHGARLVPGLSATTTVRVDATRETEDASASASR
ncbi:MAG: HlyD family secretion protein [Sandaracinus sp.]